jgi:hypothetical protein
MANAVLVSPSAVLENVKVAIALSSFPPRLLSQVPQRLRCLPYPLPRRAELAPMDPAVVPTSTSAKARPLATAAARQVSADPQLVTVKLGVRRRSATARIQACLLTERVETRTSINVRDLVSATAVAHRATVVRPPLTVLLDARLLLDLVRLLIFLLMAHAEARTSTNARDPGLGTVAAHLATAVQPQATAQWVAKVLLEHALPPTSHQTALAAALKAMYANPPRSVIVAAHLATAV